MTNQKMTSSFLQNPLDLPIFSSLNGYATVSDARAWICHAIVAVFGAPPTATLRILSFTTNTEGLRIQKLLKLTSSHPQTVNGGFTS